MKNTTLRIYGLLAAIPAGFAVVWQLLLMLQNRTAPVPETLTRFFSFYTILTNILVAVCGIALLAASATGKRYFLAGPSALTATTVYIVVVGGVYNIILRKLWQPQGGQYVVDELLHVVVPVLFLLCWIGFVPKKQLQWKQVFGWLLYPLAYVLFILTRGALSGFYPYPFVDVGKLGYGQVLINCLGLTAVFLLLSCLCVLAGKIAAGKRGK